jgi:actin-related protein
MLSRFESPTAERLANNVFLTGGLASLPGLTARLHKELQVIISLVFWIQRDYL